MSLWEKDFVLCLCCRERMKKENISVCMNNMGICRQCRKKLGGVPENSVFEGGENVMYLLSPFYYNDVMKGLIGRFKFQGEWAVGDVLAELLYEYLKDISYVYDSDITACVPISRKRFLKRGYNQSELLVRTVSEKLGIKYLSCIHKTVDTVAQSSLRSNERRTNQRNVYLADRERVEGKNILLFDDIFTTGATMNECAAELKNKGAKNVVGVALAVASHASGKHD